MYIFKFVYIYIYPSCPGLASLVSFQPCVLNTSTYHDSVQVGSYLLSYLLIYLIFTTIYHYLPLLCTEETRGEALLSGAQGKGENKVSILVIMKTYTCSLFSLTFFPYCNYIKIDLLERAAHIQFTMGFTMAKIS